MTTGDDPIARLQEEIERSRRDHAWPQAVAAIVQLVELESDPVRRAGWYDVAARICRDEMLRRDDALEYFDLALDSYFMHLEGLPDAAVAAALESFAAIERMRTEWGQWKDLDRAYRRMIVRVKSATRFDRLTAELFDKLGELYRSRLFMESSAEAAFEMSAQIKARAT